MLEGLEGFLRRKQSQSDCDDIGDGSFLDDAGMNGWEARDLCETLRTFMRNGI